MSTYFDNLESGDSNRRLLEQIKEHVVQVEALNVYVVLFIGALSLVASFESLRSYAPFIACAFLASLPAVVRVTNPRSSVRNRLTWGATLGGLGAAIGTAAGALVDVAALGLTAGAFTAGGLALGAAAGAAAGDRIESWRNQDELMPRGKAFAWLYERRHQNPELSNPSQIKKILDTMPKYDPDENGQWVYAIDDLKKVARQK